MIANYKRTEITDTGHCLSELTVSGHCLNDLTVSGKFIKMAKNANLMAVSEMILERARITSELQQVENKLLSCNHPPAVADYGLWCAQRKKDFETELKKLAAKLETQNCQLKIKLQQVDEQLAQQDIGSEWTVTGDFVSLIPKGRVDPGVALRFAIINANPEKSHLDICRVLDSYWGDRERPPGFFPEGWTGKYGVTTFVDAYRHPKCRNLVHTMISKARATKFLV